MICMSGCTSYETRPIVDAQGRPVQGSVASLEKIKLGGVDQWILVRGVNTSNPILLKVHGGPGQAEMATVEFNRSLERDFIVVEWDQRGAGKSAQAIEPSSGMSIAQFVEDTNELTKFLLARFHQQKLIIVGSSWGSVVGLLAVQKDPDLYRAFVSTGQIANFLEGTRVGYQFLLGEAQRRQNGAALRDLKKIGPPPYMSAADGAKRAIYEKWLLAFGAEWHSAAKFDRVGWMISSVEYSWPEKLRYSRAAEKSFNLLLPELAAIDLNTAAPSVAIPVYFAVGRYDHMAPFEISQTYFSALSAPHKEWVWFENSAHFPQWEEPEMFHDLLVKTVLGGTETH